MPARAPVGTASPRFSVIMNAYNGARFLKQALDSLLAQTCADWELIFWDDRSEDQSAAIFERYRDPRFRYFRAAERTGLGEARNQAVRHATGEWLAFLDQDDLWLPEKLAKQVLIMSRQPEVALVYTNYWKLVGTHHYTPLNP